MAEHICPFWIGYLLASPLRKLAQNPRKILGEHVRPGMTVLDVGCAMGFFTLEMARLVGAEGGAVALDLQPRMLASLERRATRAGLAEIITTRTCGEKSLQIDDLTGQIDFALAFAVAHEVPDVPHLMSELHQGLKPGGRMLLAEPSGHVSQEDYLATESKAVQAGLVIIDHPEIRRSHATLFGKPEVEKTA